MAIQLAEYQDVLDELGEHAGEVLEATWHEAARVFSPRGLEEYLRGAAGLKSLGRGTDLVVSFIESAPLVAREIGEQAVSELLSAAIKMYSKTSASVLALLFSTAPTAAQRLGELDLFRGYLSLLDHLLAQAPRAIRPLLEKLDVLLGHLTLGGLRRWAMWGVSAYRTDFEGQALYFSLESPESQAVLQKERRGVLFVDVQRRLIMYLRALWGRDFFLRPTSGDFETRSGYQPYIEQYFIHLPDAFDDFSASEDGADAVPALEVYRAAAAHCAAHMVYSCQDPEAESTPPLTRLLIGVIEDARVETLAVRTFPGLGLLWKSLLHVDPGSDDGLGHLLDRMALALADDEYQDDHPLVRAARERFNESKDRLMETGLARELGLELAGLVEEMAIAFNPRTDQPSSPYRDDNRHLWQGDDEGEGAILLPGQAQVRKHVSLMEMINTLDVEFAGDDAQEVWVLPTEFYEDDGGTLNEREGKEPVSSPFHYPEWDYQTQLERPLWATLLEKHPKTGDAASIDEVLERHKPLVRRLKYLIEAVQPQGVIRQRKVEDGDDIDLNAAIQAMVDIRMGHQPDPRFGIRTRLQIRDLSVLLLVDLSESTNDLVRDAEGDMTVLDLAREAAALLADALSKIGDPFAIHGFDSNGRHDVEYYRFKDFDAPYDDKVKARLAGMTGQLSTRMGTALRHAGTLLGRRPSHKKLLLLLTDGEPADNDVRDPQYLRFDTKKAVEELQKKGISTFCVSLDPDADQYVSRIFGARNYMVLDQVARLPEKLPALYMGLTR
ncbi:MAG TPA: VWA domain-containing protein [Gammaproteobacteria bacterium]|nr:VWA domain-containing protein [Gammaproteobacteria bacterium]